MEGHDTRVLNSMSLHNTKEVGPISFKDVVAETVEPRRIKPQLVPRGGEGNVIIELDVRECRKGVREL